MLLAEGASVGLFDVIPQEKGDAFAKEKLLKPQFSRSWINTGT
jgi:hypothetical protein